ncbi:MAG: DJ-1/PfpI family protein [candidate division WOR-3 bacterium]|nr:DJ-1/PfpI family protein [candidate division WOR-3 bacterium]MCX7836793.1 DJ-1/PfpI family protein [candidate division WOR-3 bacterium]MDW8113569.1 DJ-1/PfpI family protein [candidate division WOR-3 bacterium]
MKIFKYFVLVFVIFAFCGQKKEVKKEEIKLDKKLIFLIAPKDFRDEEFKIPYEYLKKAGVKITVVSSETTEAIGMLGMRVKPNGYLNNLNYEDYDGFILIGGSGSVFYWNNKKVWEICRYFNEKNKLLAGICLAPITLVKSGVLTNRKATCFNDKRALEEFRNFNVEYVDKEVVIDGNIITANGPEASEKFAKAILDYLKKQ